MRVIKRKISLRELKTFEEGLLYGEIVVDNLYLKVDLIQSGDDMGIFTDLDFKAHGDICSDFVANLDITHVTCFDWNSGEIPNTGAISIDISGGLAPYEVLWEFDGSNDLVKTGLYGNSDYAITITDANECVINLVGTVEISENAIPTVYGSFSTDYYHPDIGSIPSGQEKPISILPEPVILCVGETATLTAEGGFASYQWYMDGVLMVGETNQILTGVGTDGAYHVVVSDAEGCEGQSESQSFEFITTPTPVIAATNIPSEKPDGSPQGAGTINDPYVVCPYNLNSQQGVIQLTLTNHQYFSNWRWNSGSTTINITVGPGGGCFGMSEPLLGNFGGFVSSICEPIILGGDPYYSNVICVQFTNGDNCIAEGEGSGGESG